MLVGFQKKGECAKRRGEIPAILLLPTEIIKHLQVLHSYIINL